MSVAMMPPMGAPMGQPMGQPMPMGGPAPMPMGGPMPPMGAPQMPPAPSAPQQQVKQGLGGAFGGSAQGRQGFKRFMSASKQTSSLVPQVPSIPRPMARAPQVPMLPGPMPQMMGAMRPMAPAQASMPVGAGRPVRGTQGGIGSAPMQFAEGGAVPRFTEIGGQDHMLAYINPEEEDLLQAYRGDAPVVEGPGGIPSYLIFGGETGWGGLGDAVADAFGGGGSDDKSSGGRDFDADMFTGSDYTYDPGDDSWSSDTSSTAAEVAAGTAGTSFTDPAIAAKADVDIGGGDSGSNSMFAVNELSTAEVAALPDSAVLDVNPYTGYPNIMGFNLEFMRRFAPEDALAAERAALADPAPAPAPVDDVFGTGNIFTETTPGSSTVDYGVSQPDPDPDPVVSQPSFDPVVSDPAPVDTDPFGTGNIFTEDEPGASTIDFGISEPDDDFVDPGDSKMGADLGIGSSPVQVTADDLDTGDYISYPTSGGGGVTLADDSSNTTLTGLEDDLIAGGGTGAVDDLVGANVDFGPVDTGPVDLLGNIVSVTVPEPGSYFDAFGNEYDTQAAATAADNAAAAQAAAAAAAKAEQDRLAAAAAEEAARVAEEARLAEEARKAEAARVARESATAASMAEASRAASAGLDLDLEDALMSQEVSPDRTYAVGDIVNEDVADILGGSAQVGETLTAGQAEDLSNIASDLGYTDIDVVMPEDFAGILDDAGLALEDFDLLAGDEPGIDLEAFGGTGAAIEDDLDVSLDPVSDQQIGRPPIMGGYKQTFTPRPLTEIPQDEIDQIQKDLMEQIQPSKLDNLMNKVFGTTISAATGLPIGGAIAKQMQGMNVAEREALIDSHISALERGATPQYDDDGNYVGFDLSTMNTFGDRVLASDNVMEFMPPTTESTEFTVTQEDIDKLAELNQRYGGAYGTSIGSDVDIAAGGSGDPDDYGDLFAQEDGTSLSVGDVLETGDFVNPDAEMSQEEIDRFQTLYDIQSEMAEADPYGGSTETGFVTGGDGTGAGEGSETFYVDDEGQIFEVDTVAGEDGDADAEIVDFDPGDTGQTVDEVINDIIGGGEEVVGPGQGPGEGEGGPGIGEGEPETPEEEILRLLRLAQRGTGSGGTTGPAPTRGAVEGLTIRGPKQFAQGGFVTPNIDRFFQQLRA